ncbi:hypothetical protein NW733_04730 [Mycoplasmopsis felis]|uniref:hypothetical protein n=1 Tax=Mycoplasmopsis felis TaxID=33923 RepID=UPI0021E0F009|nr:hypothetical protein [Mycoplasmopsis felis]MCU9931946.1 hypothetical protein [Mycoplasmopsis felis]
MDYFLIIHDAIAYAKSNNINIGPGRGSASGSLVSYLLDITTINPLEFDLLFERFLNNERISMLTTLTLIFRIPEEMKFLNI